MLAYVLILIYQKKFEATNVAFNHPVQSGLYFEGNNRKFAVPVLLAYSLGVE